MLEDDSEIADFYPRDFFVDIRGKGVAWMGEVILPIIDQDRLIKATNKLEHTLTDEERYRNRLGDTIQFTNQPTATNSVSGQKEQKNLSSTIWDKEFTEENKNIVFCYKYNLPDQKHHKCRLLSGAILPDPEIGGNEPEPRKLRVTESMLRIQENNLPNAGFMGKNKLIKRNKVVEIEDDSAEDTMKYKKYN